jgi:hypothetical protein
MKYDNKKCTIRGRALKISSFLAAGVSFGALFMAVPAYAQSTGGQGIAERARPDYDALGSRLGSFTLFPSVTTSVTATDNYRATDTNRRSDVYFSVHPEVVATSNWSRNRLEARAYFDQSLHANLSGENTTQFGASLAGAYDVSRETQLRADVSAARYVESRSSLGSFQNSLEPVRYEVLHAGVGASRSFNELSLSGNASVDYRNFHDAAIGNGLFVDQDFRDVRVANLGGNVRYDLRNGIGLIFTAQYEDDRYSFRPGKTGFLPIDVNRNSAGLTLQGGVTLELSHLIFGTVQIGYLDRKYDDPRLKNVSSLSYNADILWNVTPLTSIRARASRSVEDTSSIDFAGNTRSDFRLSVDHELYRYIIISGDAGYGHFTPNGIGVGGDEYSVGAGARYLIDRNFSVSGNLRYAARTSDSSFLRYHATSASISLRVAL